MKLLILFNKIENCGTLLIGFVLLLFAISQQVQAQRDTTEILIQSADQLEVIDEKGNQLKKLIGSVILIQDDLIFYCDTAYLYSENNELKAVGSVHIIKADSLHIESDALFFDGDNRVGYLTDNVYLHNATSKIYGDSLLYLDDESRINIYDNVKVSEPGRILKSDKLYYWTNSENAKLYGNVIIDEANYNVMTDSMDYNLRTKRGGYVGGGSIKQNGSTITSNKSNISPNGDKAIFEENVVVEDKDYNLQTDRLEFDQANDKAYFFSNTIINQNEAIIEGNKGWYSTKDGLFFIEDNASIQQENQLLKAQEILFDRNTGMATANGNVFVYDSLNQTTLLGESLIYERDKENIKIFNNPVLKILFEENDTMFLTADTLVHFGGNDSISRNFKAFHNARLVSKQLQGVSDSLSFDSTDSLFVFTGDPILWSNDSIQITADTIKISIVKNKPDSLWLVNNSFISQMELTGQFNQLKGKSMVGKFEDDFLSQLEIYKNCESLYFVAEEDSSYLGLNRSKSGRLKIVFANSTVDDILFYNNPECSFIPISKASTAQSSLNKFSWRMDEKPLLSIQHGKRNNDASSSTPSEKEPKETKPREIKVYESDNPNKDVKQGRMGGKKK